MEVQQVTIAVVLIMLLLADILLSPLNTSSARSSWLNAPGSLFASIAVRVSFKICGGFSTFTSVP
jgi:hypothetical protein